MAENMELAKQVYQTLCAALDNRNWRYEKREDILLVRFRVSGDDIPIEIIMAVEPDRQLIRLLSPISFKMSEGKRVDGALATCAASYRMADGSFDYNLADGTISFRMTASFRESVIGEELFGYMIDCSCAMVDRYNDMFLMLDKGLLSIEEFIAKM